MGIRVVAFALLLALVRSVAAEEDPITVEARYEETETAHGTKRIVYVTGKTIYPDGTRLAAGLEQESNPGQFIAWFNAMVKGKAFSVDVGPWKRPLACGSYNVEVRCVMERQPPDIAAAIRSTERGLTRLENFRADDGSVCGKAKIQVGDAERAAKDKEDSRAFFSKIHDDLSAVLTDALRVLKDAQAVSLAESYNQRVGEADTKVLDYRHDRVTVPHPKAASMASQVVIDLQDLVGRIGSAAEGSDVLVARIRENLAGILSDVGAPPPKAPEPPKK